VDLDLALGELINGNKVEVDHVGESHDKLLHGSDHPHKEISLQEHHRC